MTTNAPFLRVALLGFLVTACDPGPVGTAPPPDHASSQLTGVRATNGLGVSSFAATRQSISGTIANIGGGAPGRTLVTPSGRCHFWDWPIINQFTGDVSGTVTFTENNHAPCNFSDLVGSGPFEGEVTWSGRSGVMSGVWTTNCNADASQPVGLSCDGTMTAHGSGGLEGVQFKFTWGPGWYPFPYTGTAISN